MIEECDWKKQLYYVNKLYKQFYEKVKGHKMFLLQLEFSLNVVMKGNSSVFT